VLHIPAYTVNIACQLGSWYTALVQEVEALVWCKFDQKQRLWVARCEMFERVEGLGHNPKDAIQQLQEGVLLYLRMTKQPTPVKIQFRPLDISFGKL
jgi:hypothetical protein